VPQPEGPGAVQAPAPARIPRPAAGTRAGHPGLLRGRRVESEAGYGLIPPCQPDPLDSLPQRGVLAAQVRAHQTAPERGAGVRCGPDRQPGLVVPHAAFTVPAPTPATTRPFWLVVRHDLPCGWNRAMRVLCWDFVGPASPAAPGVGPSLAASRSGKERSSSPGRAMPQHELAADSIRGQASELVQHHLALPPRLAPSGCTPASTGEARGNPAAPSSS